MSEQDPDILPETPEVDAPETENPEIPEVPADPSDEDESVEDPEEPESSVEEVYTISQYLSDLSPLLTEGDIRTVLRKRGISSDTPLDELTERERDLAEAEAYYKLCDQPVGGSTVKDVDGSWSHTEGGWTVSKANIDMWYKKYKTLRELWGEPVISRSKIRIINL